MPPAAPIKVPVMIDRRVPMTSHAFVEALVGVRPKNFITSRFNLEQRAAGTIAFGNKNLVIDDDRITSVDAFVGAGTPGEVKIDLAASRLEANQPTTRQDKAPAAAFNRGQNRAGIA